MTAPIDYQIPLPAGYRLRYVVSDDGVCISREPPGPKLLWSEALAPLILLISFTIFSVLIWGLPHRLNLSPDASRGVHIAGYLCLAAWVIRNGRRAWQNVGIVVEIAVSEQKLYWRKQNLWGAKEYFWPLSSIRAVAVRNRLLKVYRRGGPALAAFSFVKAEERAYASTLLNTAIARERMKQSKNSTLRATPADR